MAEQHSHSAINVFLFSYLSAAGIIALFATGALLLNQVTYAQEVQARSAASAMNEGMIRSQRLLRNAIVFIGPASGFAQALTQMRADMPVWEAVHDGYVTHPDLYSPDEAARLQAEEHDYQTIKSSILTLLALEPRKLDKQALVAISTIFYTEPKYFSALYAVFTTLNSQADDDVSRAQLIDTLIYLGTLVTLLLEYAFVIRPANQKLRTAMLPQAKES